MVSHIVMYLRRCSFTRGLFQCFRTYSNAEISPCRMLLCSVRGERIVERDEVANHLAIGGMPSAVGRHPWVARMGVVKSLVWQPRTMMDICNNPAPSPPGRLGLVTVERYLGPEAQPHRLCTTVEARSCISHEALSRIMVYTAPESVDDDYHD